jgi:N-acetylglutamate synthase
MQMNEVRRFEEMAMNAWPALRTVMQDGWVLRLARGYSKRANSVHPFYCSTLPLDEKIAFCEQLYAAQGIRTAFKMDEFSEPEGLDAELERRGYAKIDVVSVQTRPLGRGELPEPKHAEIVMSPAVTEAWVDSFCAFTPKARGHRETILEMMSGHVLDVCFAQMQQDGRTVACGLAVRQESRVGLMDIVTDPECRGQGLAHSMMLHLMRWGKERGAEEAFLQVVTENAPALRLYEKLGFAERYQQWYRVKG